MTCPAETTRTETDAIEIAAGLDLCDYLTGDTIRPATGEEADRSAEASRHDGGAGVIRVDGRSCYVRLISTIPRRATRSQTALPLGCVSVSELPHSSPRRCQPWPH